MKILKLISVLAGAMLAFQVGAQTNSSQKLAVKVQDFSGQPVAGATIEYYVRVADETEKPTTQTTGTDGLANLTIEKDGGQVVARKAGMGIDGSSYSSGTAQPIVLTIGQPRSISGTVLDESDKPVPGAKVSVCFINLGPDKVRQRTGSIYTVNPELQNYLSAQTGPDGRFRIEGIPTNSTLDLIVNKSGKALVMPQRNPPNSRTMCRAGQEDIALKMQPAGTVEGKVLIPESGYDMSHVSLTLVNFQAVAPIPPHTKPAADGSFRFEAVAAGNYQIFSVFGSRGAPDWVANPVSVSVEPGKVARDVKIPATRGAVVEIATFSSAGHTPLADVNVYLSGTQGQSGTTGTNGVAFMRVVPGTYHVSANKDGANASQNSVQFEEGKTNRVELELLAPLQISGTVRGTNGTPVAGIQVTAYGWNPASATTDSNGHYRVSVSRDASRSSSPYILVRDRARNLAAVRDVEDGTVVCDLQLAPGAILSGHVQDEQGKPLPNAKVNVVAWGGNTGWWIESQNPPTTDEQGRFESGAWPIGRRYSLEISAKGYGAASAKIESVETNHFEFEAYTLRLADKKIAGVVVNSENKPVSGARVYTYGNGQPQSNATTDQQGRFAIDGVCEGPVRISASTQSEPLLQGDVQAEGGDTNIVLTLGEHTFSRPAPPRRASLVGKPLPDLTPAGFSTNTLQTNKPLLICLFDPEQRPSRRAVRLLGDQYESLKQKDLIVLGLFATQTTADALNEWKQSNPVPFPVSGVTEKTDQNKWILSAEKFPWLILTDPQGRVKAEGFDLDELDAKLK